MIIHQIWLQGIDKVPRKYIKSMNVWKSLGNYMFWDDESIKLLIIEHFPYLLDLYNEYPIYVQKADLGRYVILYLYGGLYVDMDTTVVGDVIEYLQDEKAVTFPSVEYYNGLPPFNSLFRNWLIYVPYKHHPFMNKVLKGIEGYRYRKWYHLRSYYVSYSTGSRFLSLMSEGEKITTKKFKKKVRTSYDSTWGGIYKLDIMDVEIIFLFGSLFVIFLLIIAFIIYKVYRR